MVFDYIYDFGDGWEHTVKIEKLLCEETDSLKKSVVIAGKRACPPEDCGGPYLYQQLTKILKDPAHPQFKKTAAKFAGFNPETFSRKQ